MPWLIVSPGHQYPWLQQWNKISINHAVSIYWENIGNTNFWLPKNASEWKASDTSKYNTTYCDKNINGQKQCTKITFWFISFVLPDSKVHGANMGPTWAPWNLLPGLFQLEQLERLCSEDTPRRLMITHTIESYWIPSQKKKKSNSQI